MEIFLGIGSNVGDRLANLRKAIASLNASKNFTEIASSAIYETKAILPEGAPDSWDVDYLNMVVSTKTNLTPQELLVELKSIEQDIGRVARGFWSPREIDLDILIYGEQNINSEELIIPHQHMLNRAFVLLPLNNLCPNLVFPGQGEFYGKKIAEIVKERNFPAEESVLTNYKL